MQVQPIMDKKPNPTLRICEQCIHGYHQLRKGRRYSQNEDGEGKKKKQMTAYQKAK